MADAGLFIGWGGVVRGREARSLDVFQEALTYYGGLQQSGTIESIDAVFLEPHGGDLGGFFLIKGERAKLAALRVDTEFTRISAGPAWSSTASASSALRSTPGSRSRSRLSRGDLRAQLRRKQDHGRVCHPPGRDRI